MKDRFLFLDLEEDPPPQNSNICRFASLLSIRPKGEAVKTEMLSRFS